MKSLNDKWSLKYNNCISCNTTLKSYKGKGLCSKCYSVYQEIAKMNRVNIDELEFYKLQYLSYEDRASIKNMGIEAQKEIVKGAIEGKKLKYIKQYGLIETKTLKVDILKLEDILNTIANRFAYKNNIYTNHLSIFNTKYKEEDRRTIALLLLEMLV